MVVTVPQQTSFYGNVVSHVFLKRLKHRNQYVTTFASKNDDDLPQTSKTHQRFALSFKLPYPILAQSAVALFALGFIDAGYSGDWSRIGVISKESEEFLKVAALLVVPLCIFLIFSISKEDRD